VEDKAAKCHSLAHGAWAAYLRGDVATAGAAFTQAEALEREIDSAKHYLYSKGGVFHADYLCRVGEADYARRICEANVEVCTRNHWVDDLGESHRVLGDLDFDSGQVDSARKHYDAALKLARNISKRDVLIEALLARGRFNAKQGVVAAAQSDLSEALDYATASGYRIYEADIRIALAWMHRAKRDMVAAWAEASRAKQMSEEMEYYWGKMDADEVLSKLQ